MATVNTGYSKTKLSFKANTEEAHSSRGHQACGAFDAIKDLVTFGWIGSHVGRDDTVCTLMLAARACRQINACFGDARV